MKNRLFIFLSLFMINSLWAEEYAVIINRKNNFSKANAREYFLLKTEKWPNGEKVTPFDFSTKGNIRAAIARNKFIKKMLGFSNSSSYREYWIRQKSKGKTRKPQKLSSVNDVVRYVKREEGGIGIAPVSKANGVKIIAIFSL